MKIRELYYKYIYNKKFWGFFISLLFAWTLVSWTEKNYSSFSNIQHIRFMQKSIMTFGVLLLLLDFNQFKIKHIIVFHFVFLLFCVFTTLSNDFLAEFVFNILAFSFAFIVLSIVIKLTTTKEKSYSRYYGWIDNKLQKTILDARFNMGLNEAENEIEKKSPYIRWINIIISILILSVVVIFKS